MAVSEFEARRRVVSAGLAEHKLDALLVSFGANLRYLSGFTGSNGELLVLEDSAILFTDPRYRIQASQEVACRVHIGTGAIALDVVAAVAKLGLRRIGYEPAHMTCQSFEAVRARLPLRSALHPVMGWVEELRMVKSPEEVALVRRSVETNSRAFEQVAPDYPDVEDWHLIVDNCAHQLVKRPEQFDVLVMTNMNGDILSDLSSALVGGLGFAPSANIGSEVAIFEAVHGSAPKYAGKDVINPTALILSSVLMLRYLELFEQADAI